MLCQLNHTAQGQAQSISGWPDSPQAQERVRGHGQPAYSLSPLFSESNSKLEREVGLAGDRFPFPGWMPGRLDRVAFCSPTILSGEQGCCLCKTEDSRFLAGIRACDVGGACLSLSPLTTSCSLPSLALIPSPLPHSSLHSSIHSATPACPPLWRLTMLKGLVSGVPGGDTQRPRLSR